MIILVTGSREWPEEDFGIIYDVLSELKYDNPGEQAYAVFHGAARGVDTYAKEAAKKLGIFEFGFYPEWVKHGKGAGPIRNQRMVDAALSSKNTAGEKVICVVFRKDQSRGATDCGQRAEKAGIETIWIDYEDLDS